jgi:hypothetical protein
LYEYEEYAVLLKGRSRIDQITNQPLPSHQKIFRHYDHSTGQTSYFYRTNEQLVGKCAKPILIKKNYRLGISQPLNLLQLTKQQTHQEKLELVKPQQNSVSLHCSADSASPHSDFQEHLLTTLLLFCETAQFIQLPLEQEQVPKELNSCNQNIQSHFKSKPLLHFTFNPTNVPLVLQFLNQLDQLSEQFAVPESSEFYF